MSCTESIGSYLIDRLITHGVTHVFGIPGDYVLGFYDLLERCPGLTLINTCDEQGAGFAADAYARLRGLGVVCITYGVGGLKVANTTAQAYAEKSPVLVISGAPGVQEVSGNRLLHHQITDFGTQKRVFEEFTVASAVIASAEQARFEIDRVLAAVLRYKRPGYIELPRDLVHVACQGIVPHLEPEVQSDPETLDEALNEACGLINSAERPVILAGVEVHRFGLHLELAALARDKGIPVAATILAKSVVADSEDFYLGIYQGGLEATTEYVDSSDCLIILGAFLSDLNLGLFTSNLNPSQAILATSERISIKRHRFDQVLFTDFVRGLGSPRLRSRPLPPIPRPVRPKVPERAFQERPITVARLFAHINGFLQDNTTVVADVGDALFGANDLYIHQSTEFLSPAYYASLGFAVPGALGAQLAAPKSRCLVLVGDGAFQMTGMELAAIARYRLNPIVIVLNNQGYSTERPMLDGPFNDIHPWHFSRIPDVLGTGLGLAVRTEGELQTALIQAEANTASFSIIDVHLGRDDRSPMLRCITEKLASRVRR